MSSRWHILRPVAAHLWQRAASQERLVAAVCLPAPISHPACGSSEGTRFTGNMAGIATTALSVVKPYPALGSERLDR
jgi:hypothetical protein